MRYRIFKVFSLLVSVLLLLCITACGDQSVPEEPIEAPAAPQKLSAWIRENLENFQSDEWMNMHAFTAAYNGRRSRTYDLDGKIKTFFDTPLIVLGVQNGPKLDLTKPLSERGAVVTTKVHGSNDLVHYTYEFYYEQSEDVYIRVKIEVGVKDQELHQGVIDQMVDTMMEAFANREKQAKEGTIWTGGEIL